MFLGVSMDLRFGTNYMIICLKSQMDHITNFEGAFIFISQIVSTLVTKRQGNGPCGCTLIFATRFIKTCKTLNIP